MTNEVLELTTVPVVVVAGEAASKAERYGIPAGFGAGLVWLVVAAANYLYSWWIHCRIRSTCA